MQVLSDRGPTVFGVTLAFISAATGFVVLRMISKWGITRKVNADDFAIIIGWVFAVGLSVCIMIGTQVGLGAPDAEIKPEWKPRLQRCIYAFTVLYSPAIMATKTSILILYYRMGAAHPFLRYASLSTMAVVNIAGVVLTFLCIFQCRPVTAAFSPAVEGTCIDIITLYLSSTPINILTDVAILVLPLPILTSLRMEFRQKVILVFTFVIGGFVTVVGVVRIVYLQDALKEELLVAVPASTGTASPPNFTYYASFSLMWSVVEVSVGIMCCCILVLKPLVMRVMPRLINGPRTASVRPPLVSHSSTSKPRWSHSSTPSIHMPVGSPAAGELRLVDSHVSPLSPGCPTLAAIQEHPDTSEGAGDSMDFFQMLADNPPTPPPSDSLRSPLQMSSRCEPTPNTMECDRRQTRTTVQTDMSQGPTQTFFDFVQVKSRTPLTQLTAREAWWPIVIVSTLDFLWGFANGLVGGLSAQIQTLLGSSPSHTIALNNIFYCAYFVGPLLVGYWVLNLAGFKATFITGLAIYAVGALAFWPSSVLLSYAGFVVSNFMLALGLSCLELAANLFIILAGPSELSEARFNFAQGFFGVGIIVSPIVAEKALFSSINQEDLFRVQWCYLAVGLFAVLLALIFYYCPLSEASDDEIEEIAEVRLYNAGLTQSSKAFSLGARRLLLWSGALVLFFSQGTEAVNYSWTPIVQYVKPGSNSFWDLIIARCVLTFGRFLAAWLCFVGIPPRVILCLSLLGAFLTSLLAFVIPPGSAALMLLILYLLFQAPIYPTLFAMIMRGQGRHTKFAATIAVMSIPGGAVWPSVVYGIQLRYPTTPLWPLLLVAILHGISMTWPVVVSTNWVLRRWVDPKWSKTAATQSDDQEDSSRSGHQSGFAPQPNAVPELLTRGTARHRDGVDGSEYTEAQA